MLRTALGPENTPIYSKKDKSCVSGYTLSLEGEVSIHFLIKPGPGGVPHMVTSVVEAVTPASPPDPQAPLGVGWLFGAAPQF